MMSAHGGRLFINGDMQACRDMIRDGSKSFYLASLLLPRRIRHSAMALYAFCRLSDDLVDEGEKHHDEALGELRRRLDLIYRGFPSDHFSDRAFQAVVQAFDIPQAIPQALIEGYEWDVAGCQYETIDELIAYAARVAATVGVMMSLVMGRRDPHVLARAADLGVAMQLTNIARDVGEDARNGRIYLPQNWLREEGIRADTLIGQPEFSPPLGRVVARLLKEADLLYFRGLSGLGDLPPSCQPAIYAAGLVYQDIGRQIKQNGFDSVSQRACTTKSRKLFLCTKAILLPTWMYISDKRPSLAETQFLVDAAARKKERKRPFWGAFDKRMEQFVCLVEALEQRDRSLVDSSKAQTLNGSKDQTGLI